MYGLSEKRLCAVRSLTNLELMTASSTLPIEVKGQHCSPGFLIIGTTEDDSQGPGKHEAARHLSFRENRSQCFI